MRLWIGANRATINLTQVRSLLRKWLQRGVAKETVLFGELGGVAQNRSEEVEVPEGDGTPASAEEQTESATTHGPSPSAFVSTCGRGSSACRSSSASSCGTGTAPPSWGSPGCSSSRRFRRRCGCCARRSSGCAARPPPPTPPPGPPSPAPSTPGSRPRLRLWMQKALASSSSQQDEELQVVQTRAASLLLHVQPGKPGQTLAGLAWLHVEDMVKSKSAQLI